MPELSLDYFIIHKLTGCRAQLPPHAPQWFGAFRLNFFHSHIAQSKSSKVSGGQCDKAWRELSF